MRIHFESIPAPEAVRQLVGHRFEVVKREETFVRGGVTYGSISISLVDPDAALAYVRERTGADDVDIFIENTFQPPGFRPLTRLHVVIDDEGFVKHAFYG